MAPQDTLEPLLWLLYFSSVGKDLQSSFLHSWVEHLGVGREPAVVRDAVSLVATHAASSHSVGM